MLAGASSLKGAEIIPVWNKVNGDGMIEDMIHDIEFLRGENQFILLTGWAEKGAIQIRDTKTGELLSTYPINTLSNYNQIEITPDSNRCIITTGGNKEIGPTIELRNLSDYILISKDSLKLDGDKDPTGNPFYYLFRDIIVDPIRPLVYVIIEKTNFNILDEFKDKFYLKVYNYETMQLVKDLTPAGYENEKLKCFDVSNDGRYLAALNEGKAFIKVWDLETYELIKNKQLYDNNLTNPNDYRCEAQDIEFSSINNDLIYYSGKFPKINQSSYSGGIFEYYLSNNNIKKIEMDKDYTGGRFIFFENETRILNYNGELDFLNLLEQTIELNAVVSFEYPFVFKVIYSNNYNIFIGNSNVNIGGVMFDSQSNIENLIEGEIIVSPNPTNGIVNINLECPESILNYQINDITGAAVAQSTLANQSGNLQFDFSPYPSGVYFLSVNCNNQIKTYKIIKES
jgi:WD40 repeat protein